MFNSISNNFGAPEISFRDYQDDRLVVLNAYFSFDPANEAYRNASVLEVKVPDLTLSKSTEAGVFAVYKDERTFDWSEKIFRYHFATVLRSWISDRNTLCIEKLTDFDDYGPVKVYIYAMYSVLNTGELAYISKTTQLSVSYNPSVSGSTYHRFFIINQDLAFLYMTLPNYISDVDSDLEITLEGFPVDFTCGEFPILGVNNQYHYDMGGVHYASIRDGKILIPYETRDAGYSSADKPFIYLAIVRESSSVK